MIGVLVVAVVLGLLAQSSFADPWDWSQVTIGGGGYVLGLISHPTVPDLVYTRCDVGGIFRFNFTEKRWIPLVEMFGPDEKNLYGGESIAIDPHNPDILYAAAGMYSIWGPGVVLKSYDRGDTWQRTGLSLLMGGNEDWRWSGERMMVDPNDSNVIFFGSRYEGMWMSKNAGDDWQYVSSLPNGTHGYGILFTLFDPVQEYIYASVSGEGVYMSGDGGNSWKLLSGSPANTLRGIVTPINNVLIVAGPTGVFKYEGGAWSDISPTPNIPYCGISVHPTNPSFLIVAENLANYYNNLYRSTDGGNTWTNIYPSATAINVPWWPSNYFSSATAVFSIDTLNPLRAYMTCWYGVYFCDDITKENTTWYTMEKGHEEIFALSMHVPSNGGVLLVGTADVNGFRIPVGNFSEFPNYGFLNNMTENIIIQDSTFIDSAFNNPNIVARVGTTEWTLPTMTGGGGYSTDNGVTWKGFTTLPVTNNYPIGGAVAVSADGSTIIWWPFQSQPYMTTDFGASWVIPQGASINNGSCCHAAPVKYGKQNLGIDLAYQTLIQADKVNASVFYLFNEGVFSVSTDAGKSFQKASVLPGWSPSANIIVYAVPYMSGEVWVSFGGTAGLWRSSNFGTTFTRISSVTSSLLFAFGKNAPNSKYPALYVMGTIGGVQNVFVSNDMGSTWTSIGSDTTRLGDNPWSMTADPVTYGQVYVGTLGHGVYFGTVSA